MTSHARDMIVSMIEIVKWFWTNSEKVMRYWIAKLIIMQNDKPEAVIVSADEYEKMKELYDYAERLSILETVQQRRNNGKFIPFDEVLKMVGLSRNDLRN